MNQPTRAIEVPIYTDPFGCPRCQGIDQGIKQGDCLFVMQANTQNAYCRLTNVHLERDDAGGLVAPMNCPLWIVGA